ncbi:Transposon Ty3-I Gag-Pol polyprotein [Araneus ventricosus]|uniref:Transposon Ty3-I Gag-Pol polyprotein n=1 Tax=Araneus ventricosus TaxID=182803 RepID=A0A4Y2M1M4_ARAVE|nr:Transposon Ty3-I Gag-Pol polyprotein [Araneus ventricosus]
MCLEALSDWEKILPKALFALRTVLHDSTGFSPAELVHGKNPRTPVMLLYEKLTEEDPVENSVVEYVFELINRMKKCQELDVKNMEDAKQKQKLWYDRKTVKRQFRPGELVLVVAPSRPTKLSVQWMGPGDIVQQLSETNYVVKFPEKDRTCVYHVNMLKPYYQTAENINLLYLEENLKLEDEEDMPNLELDHEASEWSKFISDIQQNLKLSHLQREELLCKYSNIFSNNPGCTDLAQHDIELESDRPMVAKPYRMSPRPIDILKMEVNRMIELKIVEPGESDFTSPLILEVPGKDARPCIDYRRFNKVTRTQYFPLPNIEELIEKVSAAKYISVLELTRGYRQMPLSPRAQRYAAFVTTFGNFRPLRLPFGLKNAPYYFSRLMASLLRNSEDNAVPYLDHVAIFSQSWKYHLGHLEDILDRPSSVKLRIKLSKCQFARSYVK